MFIIKNLMFCIGKPYKKLPYRRIRELLRPYFDFGSGFSPARGKPFTALRATTYSTEHSGTLISIPTTPIALPPIVTATRTQMPGRPTDLPTTLG